MKILIYEPGNEGHRPVYLRYIDEAFREAGCETMVVTQSYSGAPWRLAALAAQSGAQVVFVCTMDGIFGWLAVLGLGCRLRGVRVVGIYYLFNNLFEGWKRHLWRSLLQMSILGRIFVPDLNLAARDLGRAKGRITFLADPWDKRFLSAIPRAEALKKCGIYEEDACVFLVFGELSERKGLHLVVKALLNWDFETRPHVKVLAAGRATQAVKQQIADALARNSRFSGALILHDRWIEEREHSRYFAAASYLCALYPKSFKVSISTVLRAFAVGRPVIVGDHGMIGEVVHKVEAGFVCDTANSESVRFAFEQAYDLYCAGKDRDAYERMAIAGHSIAGGSELEKFKCALHAWTFENVSSRT